MKRTVAILALIQLVACGGSIQTDAEMTYLQLPEIDAPELYVVEVDFDVLDNASSFVLDSSPLQISIVEGVLSVDLDQYKVHGPLEALKKNHTVKVVIDRRLNLTRLYIDGKLADETHASAEMPAFVGIPNDSYVAPRTPREPRPPVVMELGGETPPEINTPKPPTTAGGASHAIVDLDGDPAGSLVNPPAPPVTMGNGSVAMEDVELLPKRPRPPVVVNALTLRWQPTQGRPEQASWVASQTR